MSSQRFVVCLLAMASLLACVGLAAAQASPDARLIEAAMRRDPQAVRALLAQGATVNARQADGATALHWAAHLDDTATADVLLQAKADANAVNELGVAPLSLACTNGSAPMVQRLLKAGADPNAAVPSGETVLMTCVQTGTPAAVAALLAAGADPNRREELSGQTALMWAVAETHPEVVRLLIQRGADVQARSKGGFTALAFAAQEGDIESARILLDAGARVERVAAPDCGSTTRSGGFGFGSLGGLMNDTESIDPLVLATLSYQEAFAIFLLEHGADPHAADCSLPVLFYAIRKGIIYIRRDDMAGRADDPRMRLPNMRGLVKALLERGVDPNTRLKQTIGGQINTTGATPLLLAAVSSDVALMRLLLEHGADPTLSTVGNTTPLMAATGVGRYDERSPEEEAEASVAVKLLVELGADVNAVNNDDRQTALHGAAFVGGNANVEYLVGKGARMEVMDKLGQTPLSIAMGVITKGTTNCEGPGNCFNRVPQGPHPTTAQLLLKLGATPLEQSGVELIDTATDTAKIRQRPERERRP